VVNELTNLSIGSLLASISLAGLLYLSFRDISRFLFIFFAVQAYIYTVTWRLISRSNFLNKKNQKVRNVLIIGAGKVGQELQNQIIQTPYLGLRVIGFLDDDLQKKGENNWILGDLSNTRAIVREKQAEDIVIALPRRAYAQVSKLVAELHDLPVKIWVIPDYFQLALHKAEIAEFAGIPMLDLRAPALSEYQRLTKRIFDLIIGIISLILISPLMAIISIAIKLDSEGPILYKSQRLGENGRFFWMFKFRSMVVGADQRLNEVVQFDQDGNSFHKSPDDPRITRVGKFIRRTSLDELPQLLNVLKGEMSLVGPRPEIPTLVQNYKPWQRKRFVVPQGITGWWQINGRSVKPMHLHTEDDIYYIQNYSLLLDIYILLKTAWVVLKGNGAF
jgi:exopolysaccharide biosynthesis polyprenyl glycosylphosphotransferase